jgi:hypothetical protein
MLCYLSASNETFGPDAYLWARLLWDPEHDPEQILREYFTGLYGSAWPHVKRYYETVARRRAEASAELIGPSPGGHGKGLNTFLALIAYAFADATTLPACVQAAKEQTERADPPTRERLERFCRAADLADATSEALRLGSAIDHDPSVGLDTAAVAGLRSRLDDRFRLLDEIRGYGDYGAQVLQRVRSDIDRNNLDRRLTREHPLYRLAEALPLGQPKRWLAYDFEPAAPESIHARNCRHARQHGALLVGSTEEGQKFGVTFLFEGVPAGSDFARVSMKIRGHVRYPHAAMRGALTTFVGAQSAQRRSLAPFAWRQAKMADFRHWTHYNHYAPIPKGTRALRFTIYVYNPKGHFWLDDLAVDLFSKTGDP